MRFARILVPMAAAFWMTATVFADQHGHAPVPHPTQAHATPATSAGSKTPAATSTRSGSTHHDGDHHTSTHTPPPATSTGSKTPASATPPGSRHHDGDHHSGTHTPSTSPIATKIQSHPNLAAKVTAMLPPGMTMNQAALGFKNQGQFIAALHASQRTGIPFADLKRAMVTHHQSLGQAVHSLRPSANGSREAQHAEHDADHDIEGSHPGTGRTATGTTTGTTPTATPTTTRKHVE
jgi:hypothetical protein